MPLAAAEKTPNLEALFREAELYEEAGDFRKAFEYLAAAAKHGHVGSQLNLGNYYAWGRGVRRSLAKAAFWYKKAYRNGESNGALNLAIDKQKQGNVRSAATWLKRAVAMDNGDAHIALAKIYNAQNAGKKRAILLLRRSLQLHKSDISAAAREEAESLLKEWKRHPAR